MEQDIQWVVNEIKGLRKDDRKLVVKVTQLEDSNMKLMGKVTELEDHNSKLVVEVQGLKYESDRKCSVACLNQANFPQSSQSVGP